MLRVLRARSAALILCGLQVDNTSQMGLSVPFYISYLLRITQISQIRGRNEAGPYITTRK